MSERLLKDTRGFVWVEFPGDWAALYRGNDLVWQGHPGDFEWAWHLGMPTAYNGILDGSHAPLTLREAVGR